MPAHLPPSRTCPTLQAGWASAEGVLSYKCNGAPSSAAPLRLGVEGDGQYA